MPRKPKAKPVDLPTIPAELLEQFGNGPMTADAINAATLALKKALIERALGGEMSHHLGYPPGAAKPGAVTNQRNGSGAKTVLTEDGPIRIEVPRDRDGSFEPLLIPKHERRFTGFDDKIVAMYARGMTVREIQGFLQEQYGTEVSPDFISSVTDEVMVEVTAWQARPLEPMYPVVFFDALRVKIREDAVVRNKAIYLALGVLPDGTRDILGLWIEGTEGAKFWMKVFNDLKTRGVHDILIAVTDGLKGMPEALAAVFPATTPQTCIVHLIRNSLDYASWKDRRGLAAVIRPIYTAPSAEAAQAELDAFADGPWGQRFPTVSAAWRNAWDRVIPFFAFPPAVRKIIYTTNAIENINSQLRKIIKTRGHFPTDEAATKLIWLALRNITADWGRAAHDWKTAMNQFAILYEDRFVRPSV
ncbi:MULTISPECIES: IS256 family transposase [Burkholderia cepacia complex]|uniref:Mutator family transposase n=2 Tax=Burkholderia cepacia complex TaxID=87882 RepID=A0AAD0NBA9_9BURK|nr:MULTISPECIES: IS256 family transposase [Burkholderia cepacia complex]EAY65949.1 Transposase, mutator type [Burkholderia cenocepacia PC184]ACA93594.1 transposase mutator type [Burkholderia orbicola MC0-3]AWG29273.1 IS256 family transposase [Burkholderia cenocepacia]MCA8089126.1 IS256 family transposase [Burkholderia cenocepacia]HEM7885285.1 IS256 family transposase [Burkholderia cenocepacia]